MAARARPLSPTPRQTLCVLVVMTKINKMADDNNFPKKTQTPCHARLRLEARKAQTSIGTSEAKRVAQRHINAAMRCVVRSQKRDDADARTGKAWPPAAHSPDQTRP